MAYESQFNDSIKIKLLPERLSQYIRALNERRQCIGLSPVSFYTTSGTSTYPAASDLYGLLIYGYEMKYNVELLQDKTIDLIDNHSGDHTNERFVTTENGTTLYTKESMETACGLGEYPDSEDIRIWNLNFWERLAETFSRLIYVKVWPKFDESSYDYVDTNYQNSGYTDAAFLLEWEALSDTTNSLSGEETATVIPVGLQQRISYNIDIDDDKYTYWRATIYDAETITLSTAKYNGVISDAGKIHIQDVKSYWNATSPDNVDITVEGTSHTISSDNAVWDISGSSIFTVDNDTEIEMIIDAPLDNPFEYTMVGYGIPSTTGIAKVTSTILFSVNNNYTYFWLNLNTVLSDRFED